MSSPHLDEFLNFLRFEKGLSSHTVAAYGSDVCLLEKFLQEAGVQEATTDLLLQFLGRLKKESYASASICRIVVSIKLFFRFLKKEGFLEVDLGAYLDLPKVWQLLPEVLSKEEAEALLETPKEMNFIQMRDKAILELLYATGMRVSELCQCEIGDVGDGFVKVRGKGRKERLIPVGKKAIDAIDLFLLHFRGEVIGDEAPLFITKKGKRIDRMTVWERVKFC